MDPAPTCFPLQLIIPEGWPPSSQSPSTSLILGRGNGSRTVLRGLGMSFFNLSISMESNRSCFKWTATSWLRFGAIHTFQLHTQPSTDQPISSVLQSSHDIGSKTRKSDFGSS
ncbi:hypothetical protein PS2_008093 [Malus domestica]